MVEPQPSKLMAWVRFPSPAPIVCAISPHSLVVEHFLGKEEVTGSIPVVGSDRFARYFIIRYKLMVKDKRPVAQLVEQRSPKPQVGGSIPSWPARWFGRVWRLFGTVRTEVLKVSWPSLQEVIQTTFVIGVVVFLASLFLWGIDSLILYAIKWLVRQKG
jgi:preprotein translocase SecE subunit